MITDEKGKYSETYNPKMANTEIFFFFFEEILIYVNFQNMFKE